MSDENERKKSNYSARVAGLVAAAIIAVVAGAALYYYFGGGSSQNWRREDTHIIFRERSLSLEKCSICFDVILKDQEVLSLACTHQFHAACVMRWLEQSHTCPNCRKSVD